MAGMRDRHREQQEELINGAANVHDLAHVMEMMDLLGTWTDSATHSASARTLGPRCKSGSDGRTKKGQ